MPNWCAGTFRIRGTMDNIKNFIKDEFEVCSYNTVNNVYEARAIDKMYYRIDWDTINPSTDWVSVKINDDEWIHLKSPYRVFIEWNEDYNIGRHTFFITSFEQEDNKYLVIFPIKQAWDFRAEEWAELSKKYNLDFHLFGWEAGMMFDREIEILNGNTVKNKSISFSEWYWNTANPFLGG